MNKLTYKIDNLHLLNDKKELFFSLYNTNYKLLAHGIIHLTTDAVSLLEEPLKIKKVIVKKGTYLIFLNYNNEIISYELKRKVQKKLLNGTVLDTIVSDSSIFILTRNKNKLHYYELMGDSLELIFNVGECIYHKVFKDFLVAKNINKQWLIVKKKRIEYVKLPSKLNYDDVLDITEQYVVYKKDDSYFFFDYKSSTLFVASITSDIYHYSLYLNGAKFLYYKYEKGQFIFYILNIKNNSLDILPLRNLVAFNFVKKDDSLLFVGSSPFSKEEIYVHDMVKNKTKKITSLNNNTHSNFIDKIDSKSIGDISTLLYKGKKETNILFILLHGGPHSYDLFEYSDEILLLLSIGGDVLTINYAGSLDKGRKMSQIIYGKIGTIELENIFASIQYYSDEYENIYLMGYSYGGYLSLKFGSYYPNLIEGCLSINAVYDWTYLYSQSSSPQKNLIEKLHGSTPYEDTVPFEKSSLLNNKNLHPNTVILHGLYDSIIPIEQMYFFIEKYNKEIQHNVLKNSGHYIAPKDLSVLKKEVHKLLKTVK